MGNHRIVYSLMTIAFSFLLRFPVAGFATRRQFQCQRRHITSITQLPLSSGSWKQLQFCHYHGRRRHITSSITQLNLSSDTKSISSPTKNKWEFVATDDSGSLIKNILVCGDGDLSYTANVAKELSDVDEGIKLFATVLEDEETHNKVYQYSKANTDIIKSHGQEVLFGIDATSLGTYFDNESIQFDRIQFNFPHWRGKANNRYNRQLINEFFKSAATMLSTKGEVHVALCDGQGGCSATSLQEWKGSWQSSLFAAEHGLLLASVTEYDATYNLSSHRGVDRPFKLGAKPEMHVFVKPDGMVEVPKDIQLCCRHELHIVIPEDHDGSSSTICSLDQIVGGDAIQRIIQDKCVPDGVRVEVPARQLLDIHETHGDERIVVFLIVYCSEQHHVTRQMADEWREKAEIEVSKIIPLRENRRGRTVSHAFPYPSLHPEIKYHTTTTKER